MLLLHVWWLKVSVLTGLKVDINYRELDGTHRTALAFAAMNGKVRRQELSVGSS